MPRKQKTIHYLYKTTCLVTGRYYIGMHSTANLEDGYMGSGKRLRYSIRKYGKENHVKEILEFFDSRELLVEAEKKIVSPDLMQDKNCMNLKEGGTGGFSNNEHMKKCSNAGNNKIKFLRLNDIEWKKKESDRRSKEKLGSKNPRFNKLPTFGFKNKRHSDNTKQLIRLKMLSKGIGQKNSQYGTCWITNGIENKKIKKDSEIPNGWYFGRK